MAVVVVNEDLSLNVEFLDSSAALKFKEIMEEEYKDKAEDFVAFLDKR